jgi:predicted Fe-Mo cluster-binding NifX family protein
MKVAVASQNFRTVTPHAGRTRRFLVYNVDVDAGGAATEIERLDLPKEMALHEFHGDGAHPLDAVDAVIAGSHGAGFAQRMARRGVAVFATEEVGPADAIRAFLASDGTSAPAVSCGSGDHGPVHAHGHHHHNHAPSPDNKET